MKWWSNKFLTGCSGGSRSRGYMTLDWLFALHMQIKEEGAKYSWKIEGKVTLKVSRPATQG